MKRILVINKINSSNLGDQAIGQSMKKLISKYGYEADCADLTNAPVQGIKDVNIGDLSVLSDRRKHQIVKMAKWHIKYWNKLIDKRIKDNIRSYSAVVIGGGELIQDNNIFPVALYLWISYIRRANPKLPIYFFGVGVTDKFCDFTKCLLNNVLKSVTKIYVRDYNSSVNLKNVFGIDSEVIPDVVFSASFKKAEHKERLALLGITSLARLIYYAYCQNKDEYFEILRKRVIILKEQYSLVQIVYSDNGDKALAKKFKDWLQETYSEDVQIAQYSTLDGMLDLIGRSAYIESPRMHACIIGMLCGCEICAVEISPKMQTFKEIYIDSSKQIEQLAEEVNAGFIDLLEDCNQRNLH